MTIEKKEELPQRITDSYYSKQFDLINDELRIYFDTANNEIEKVKEKVNELVVLVHGDNPTWSVKKICDYIAGQNSDLESLGFSARTIFRYLSDENRQLVDTKKQKGKPSQTIEDFRNKKGIKLHNNIIVDDDDTSHHQVIEDSSSRSSSEVIDDSIAAMPQELEFHQEDVDFLKEQIKKEQEIDWQFKYEELETRYSEVITQYEVRQTAMVKDQELPFIVKVVLLLLFSRMDLLLQ